MSVDPTVAHLKKMSLAQLRELSAQLALVPENKNAWTYTIRGFDGSPYLTRTLLPRDGNYRPLIHHIHRADYDSHLHNHPWKTARFTVVSGGYTEERMMRRSPLETIRRRLTVGDENELDAGTFHRVVEIEPDTWTIGVVGERVQEWGFLVDGTDFVEAKEYFARRGHVAPEGGKS